MYARIIIFGGKRRDADAGEDWIFPQVMEKIVEIVRTIPVDVSVLDLEEIVKLTKFQFDECNRRPLRSYGGRDGQRTIEQIVHVAVPQIPEQTARGAKVIPQELPPERIVEQTVKVMEEIDEVVRLIPQERIQQHTAEQRVIVPVLQVVKENNQSVSSTSDDTETSTNNQDGSEDSRGSSTSAVLS